MGEDFDPWGPGKQGMLGGAAVALAVLLVLWVLF